MRSPGHEVRDAFAGAVKDAEYQSRLWLDPYGAGAELGLSEAGLDALAAEIRKESTPAAEYRRQQQRWSER